jgi:acyl-CoA thioester hydrolase
MSTRQRQHEGVPGAGRTSRHDIRVPYADVDQMGVVYYGNYYAYFERARNELLREAGMPYSEMEKHGVMLPVVESHCEYGRPVRFDDLITIVTRCAGAKGPRLRIECTVERDGEQLAAGYTVHVCMSPDGRVLRPPAELKALFGGNDA